MSPSDELLRPALELAFAVALAGIKLRPPISPPPQLRPYLKFQKLPNGALPVVRKVVEDDDEFRMRTARVATEELAGRLGVVWLTRGEGWVEEVQRLVEEALLDDPGPGSESAARRAERRREAAELAAQRAQAEIAAARADAERERERRVELERRVRTLEQELADQRRIAERVVEEAKATKARGASALVAADDLRGANQSLRDRVAELEHTLDDALAARTTAEAERDAMRRRVGSAPAAAGRPELDRASGALHEAAGAIRRLAGAMEATASALIPSGTADADEPIDLDGPAAPVPGSRRTGPRRSPIAIPGGLFGDSDAVAAHLVRCPDVTLVVDGYNVAKSGWPMLSLEQQRESLLDSLESLVRRTGVRVVVFFDGADLPSPAGRRRLVRVRFTPSGVIADDAIRSFVVELPADRPVVVATNDQAIVRDVRSDGANVIGSEQLLAVLRR